MSEASTESAASSRIAQALRDDILNGSIEPGQRLRQEDIAERLGGSRLPVREALRIVAAEGLVQIEPNKGARVPLLDPGEVETLYRMRERLEPLALSESMANLSSADLAEISDIQRRIQTSRQKSLAHPSPGLSLSGLPVISTYMRKPSRAHNLLTRSDRPQRNYIRTHHRVCALEIQTWTQSTTGGQDIDPMYF